MATHSLVPTGIEWMAYNSLFETAGSVGGSCFGAAFPGKFLIFNFQFYKKFSTLNH